MYRKLHKITVGDYGQYDQTNELYPLEKYGIDDENINELIALVKVGLGDTAFLDNGFDLVALGNKVLKLETYMDTISDLMQYEAEMKGYCETLGKDFNGGKMDEWCRMLFDEFQIEVKTFEDLAKITQEIQFINDKFNESKINEGSKKGISFTNLKIKVFGMNNINIDNSVVLSDFFEMVKIAREIK